MFDLRRITGFEWDEGNARKSLEKHGVGQNEAEQLFFNVPLLLASDDKHSDVEARAQALGKTNAGRLLHVTFTLRDQETKLRVISARSMNRKERSLYEKQL
jgi:uncharacterized protein